MKISVKSNIAISRIEKIRIVFIVSTSKVKCCYLTFVQTKLFFIKARFASRTHGIDTVSTVLLTLISIPCQSYSDDVKKTIKKKNKNKKRKK